MSTSLSRSSFSPAAAAVLLMIAGCAPLDWVVQAKESGRDGVAKDYQATSDQAWAISKTVLHWEGGGVVEEHRELGYMLTRLGSSSASPREAIGVWVERRPGNAVHVTAISKRYIQTPMVATVAEGTFHRHFAQALEIVKQGKPLPEVAPE